MSCNDNEQTVNLSFGGCAPGAKAHTITGLDVDCDNRTITVSVVNGQGQADSFTTNLCPAGVSEDWTIDKDNVSTNYDADAGTFIATIPCIDRVTGTNVGNIELDLSPLIDIDTQITCAEIAAQVTMRPNADNACITELVFCAGTGDEVVVGTVNTSSFIVSFQADPDNPCILQGVRCDGSTVTVRDFSGFFTGLVVDPNNASRFVFTDCTGEEVGALVIPPATAQFTCADLIGKISVRDNATNPCIKELVLCPGEADEAVAGTVDLSSVVDSIAEVVSAEGKKSIEYRTCDDTVLFTQEVSDCVVVTQTGHGLGVAGSVVPVTLVNGTVEVANTAAPATGDAPLVAQVMAKVVDADTLELCSKAVGPNVAGLPVGSEYNLMPDGSFNTADQYAANQVLKQQVGFVLSDSCVLYCIEQAEYCEVSCLKSECAIAQATLGTATDAADQPLLDALQDIADDINTNGCTAYVTTDATTASGYRLAVAEDCIVWRAVPVTDADGNVTGFTKELNGSKGGETLTSTILAVIPQSQVDAGGAPGSAVDVNSLVPGDAQITIGSVTAEGCLHVNIGGKFEIPVEPVDPNANDFEFKPQGDLGSSGDYTENQNFDALVLNTTLSGPCGDVTTLPYDCTTGVGTTYIKECVSPPLCCGEYCYWIGFENVNPYTISQVGYIRETSGTGSTTGANIEIKLGSTGQMNLTYNNTAGGTGGLFFGPTLVAGKWYKVTINFELNSGIGTADGSLSWTVDEYGGSIAGGVDLSTFTNVETDSITGWDSHSANVPECFDFTRVVGSNGNSGGCIDPTQPAYVAYGGVSLNACP